MIKRRLTHIAKAILLLVSGLLMLVIIGSYVVSIPSVQSYLIEHSSWLIKREFGLQVQIKEVQVGLPAKAILRGVSVQDPQGQPLLSMEGFHLNLMSFSLWQYLFWPDMVHELSIGTIELEKPDVHLFRRQSDSLLNIAFLFPPAEETSTDANSQEGGRQLVLDLTSVQLTDGQFHFTDSLAESFGQISKGQINFSQIELTDIQAGLSLFLYPKGKVDVQLSQLSFQEALSGFELDHLSLNLLSEGEAPDSTDSGKTYPYTSLQDFSLQSGRTWLLGELLVPKRSLGELFSLEDGLDYEARLLEGSRLDFATLDYLVRDTLPMHGEIKLSGPLEGDLNTIGSRELMVAYANETRILASFQLHQMLEPERSFLQLSTRESFVNFQELQALLPGIDFPPVLEDLGKMGIVGKMEGGYWNFVTDLALKSKKGELEAQLHLKLPPVHPRLSYEGRLTTRNLNVDALAVTDLQFSRNLNLTGTLKGRGTDLSRLDLDANLLISQSELRGFFLDSVRTDVKLHKGQLVGTFEGADREGYANISALIDLKQAPFAYDLKGKVENINLATYDLRPDSVYTSVDFELQLAGGSLDELNGMVNMSDLHFARPGDSLDFTLPSFEINSTAAGKQKFYTLRSSLALMEVRGEFDIAEAIASGQRLFYENQLYFLNRDSLLDQYYANKDSLLSGFYPEQDSVLPEISLEISMDVLDSMDQFLAFWQLPMEIAYGSHALANFQFGTIDQVNINLDTDSLRYGEISLTESHLDLSLIKEAREPYPFMAGGVHLAQAQIGPTFQIQRVYLDMQGSDNQFETDLRALQEASEAELRLKLYTFFAEDGRVFSQLDQKLSRLVMQQDTLTLGSSDSMILEKGELFVDNLILSDAQRYVRFHGEVAKRKDSYLTISAAQLSLGLLTELYPLPYEPSGMLNMEFVGRHLLDQPRIEWLSSLNDFTLGDSIYGDIFMKGHWQEGQDSVIANAFLIDQQDTTLFLDGYYALQDSISPLRANLRTKKGFPLDYIQPFVKDQIYNVGGMVQLEKFSIVGSLSQLEVNGIGHFQEAGFGVDYFQTEYTFNGKIEFDNSRITFPRLRLYDKNRNHADLHGVILHEGLKDFSFDLQLDSVRNFLVMNTKKSNNEVFYGTLYLQDGLADITGDLERISIQAIASTGARSSLKIPVSDFSDFGRPDYIYFKKDAAAESGEAGKETNTGLLGFDLDLTVLATREAEVELIFDERVGDIIRGRGEGSISLNINEKGDFSMFGDYQIVSGDYLFTSQNVINKKFSVKEGGHITWNGDPFEAMLDIEAIYPVKANIQDLLQEDKPIRTDVNVLMHMEGQLAAPEISLSIELPNVKGIDADRVVNYLRSIQFDEQELNKQVFSLMVFNRFAPVGGDLGDNLASTGVTTSISEMLSNQLNYLLSQVTGEFVDVNVNTSNFQDVNLIVSARLFKDRVTIERDGTLVQTTDQESALLSLGNIRVIIRLLPSESDLTNNRRRNSEMVLEVFTRESFTSNAQGATTANNETGLGVFFRKDFDRLSDLLKKNQTKK